MNNYWSDRPIEAKALVEEIRRDKQHYSFNNLIDTKGFFGEVIETADKVLSIPCDFNDNYSVVEDRLIRDMLPYASQSERAFGKMCVAMLSTKLRVNQHFFAVPRNRLDTFGNVCAYLLKLEKQYQVKVTHPYTMSLGKCAEISEMVDMGLRVVKVQQYLMTSAYQLRVISESDKLASMYVVFGKETEVKFGG